MTGTRGGPPSAELGTAPAHAVAATLLAELDPSIRRFLVRVSALGTLRPPTCDALTGRADSDAVLADLERRGIIAVDGTGLGRTFRLPLLLQEALEDDLAEELAPAELEATYRSAGVLLEAAGDWWSALRAYVRAGHTAAVERLIARNAAPPRARTAAGDASPGRPDDRQPSPSAPAEVPAEGGVGRPVVAVHLLGTFEILADGSPVDLSKVRPRVRAVLQYLALHPDTYVHRDVLAAVLWPETDPEVGRRGVQVAISALRSLLQPGQPRQSTLLPRRGDAYALALAAHGSSDVVDLEAELVRARRARAAGDLPTAVAAWREVARLYRGELLLEQGHAEWVVAERDRLRLAAADALELLGRHLVTTDAVDEGIDALRRALELEPFRDGTWRTLAETHEALGDLAAAAAVRQRHRRVLVDLGVVDDEPEARRSRLSHRTR